MKRWETEKPHFSLDANVLTALAWPAHGKLATFDQGVGSTGKARGAVELIG